jgi:hypothetical protein
MFEGKLWRRLAAGDSLGFVEMSRGLWAGLTGQAGRQAACSSGLRRLTGHGGPARPLQDGFVVEGTSGKVWEDVDLSDKEWADYDDKSNESVSIMELQWEFRRG